MRPDQSARPDRPFDISNVTPQFVFGLLIMLAGGALLLDRFDVVDATYVFRLWPLALVAFGVMHFTRGARQHRFWGVFWIFTGTWLLLRSFNLIELGFWELFLPIMLIGLGVSLMMRTLSEGGFVKPDSGRSSHLFAVWGGSKKKYDGEPFEGAYMTAVMGGCDLDLRRAVVPPGQERRVVVFGLMSGHVIRIPAGWEVVVKALPVLGGIEDKRVPPVAPPPLDGAAPRLVIEGTVMLGGLELKD